MTRSQRPVEVRSSCAGAGWVGVGGRLVAKAPVLTSTLPSASKMAIAATSSSSIRASASWPRVSSSPANSAYSVAAASWRAWAWARAQGLVEVGQAQAGVRRCHKYRHHQHRDEGDQGDARADTPAFDHRRAPRLASGTKRCCSLSRLVARLPFAVFDADGMSCGQLKANGRMGVAAAGKGRDAHPACGRAAGIFSALCSTA